MGNLKRKEIFLLLFCLLIGFALRFYTFDQKSLWVDEVYTFNDSRDDLKGQLKFYKENPNHLHPPLFFILTHLFYPFEKPERDLRIIPLIFGTLSIPMIYLLARQFSSAIALPCTLALTFMAYHISLSQDGRSYSLLMFIGMAGLYFFLKHLKISKNRYLILVALLFAILFHTSYSSIPFIALSQILWFYQPNEESKKPTLSSFFVLNVLILLFCLPWILFVAFNYTGQQIMHPLHTEGSGSFIFILYGILHDWVPHLPLMISSVILFVFSPFFSSHNRRNAIVLVALFLLPVGGLYLFCQLLSLTHFISSRYFINFLPLFFITLFLSLNGIENKFEGLKRWIRFKVLFVVLFILTNLTFLPLYYRSEKQDFRGLATYLRAHLQEGDNIFDGGGVYSQGILHYLGAYPIGRQYTMNFSKDSEDNLQYDISFIYKHRKFTIYHSKTCCPQYMTHNNRLWIVVNISTAKQTQKQKYNPFVLKGFFDGSFQNFTRFPYDGSMYLFLWDPQSPDEKGIDLPIE